MKTSSFLPGIALCALLLSSALAPAASRTRHAVSLGVRHHAEHTAFIELPYDDGDVSYGLSYEFHESAGYWQLGANYASEVGSNTVDYVVTPHVNLIFKDRYWRGGIGALSTYIRDKVTDEGDWTDIYGQFLFGIAIPLGGLNFELHAAYPFEDFNALSDFEFEDIDIVGWLGLSF